MINKYYKSIASEHMSDFPGFYHWVASELPSNAWIAELGVADGRSVIMMASMMKSMNKPCKIWAVDDFSYGLNDQRVTVERNIRNSEEDTIEIMDMDSLVASCRCQDGQFDFVFIDSSHLYENTKAEIRLWLHKVKVGGIIGGHDYMDNEEVKKAVNELIPNEHLHVQDTEHKHGIWYFVKTADFKLLC